MFGQILEFNSQNSKLISQNSKLKNMSLSYENWKHVLCVFKLWELSFHGKVVIIQQLWGPTVSGHVRPFKTVGFTLFALIHLLFFSNTTLFTLPPSNFLLSLFFPWKSRCIRSGEAVQPKTRVDRRTQFVTGSLFCQFCHFGFVLHFLPLSFPFPLLYLLRCCSVIFFFFC